jgi:protein associated with RNAse G/E
MIKTTGINYYVNIASPSIIEDNVIKYIDYDLDFKVDSEYQIKTLDEYEYKKHKKLLNYSDELDEVINYNFSKVRKLIENKEFPFSHDNVDELYKKYLNKEK